MSAPIISVEGLGKRYTLHHEAKGAGGYRRLSEDLTAALRRPLDRLRGRVPAPAASEEEFWALKDVSFDVHEGEVLGVIGRNGAGKSTLLKILSRITEPSAGRVVLRGRVASLLEVGTGFHPELTGRENIYLNGAILGMSRAEIARKFDEIVAFAEVERFLDTPVKRYSSGMYVRLAFAVAAHLEPEILIVDEILAVGDAEFQRKCLGKMSEVAGGGRTVLFVSHNMAAIAQLCGRAILLQQGQLLLDADPDQVIHIYATRTVRPDQVVWHSDVASLGDKGLDIRAAGVLDHAGRHLDLVDVAAGCRIVIDYTVTKLLPSYRIALRLTTTDGTVAFTTAMPLQLGQTIGRFRAICRIPANLLNTRPYNVNVSADVPFRTVLIPETQVLSFACQRLDSASDDYPEEWPGTVRPCLKWQCSSAEVDSVPDDASQLASLPAA